MNAIKMTVLSFLFLFITAAVQGDVVRITTAGQPVLPSGQSFIQGSWGDWTLKNIDVSKTSTPSKFQASYLGDSDESNKRRNVLREQPKEKSDLVAWAYNDTSIFTIGSRGPDEEFIEIFADFTLGGDGVRWSFSGIVLTLAAAKSSSPPTAILFAEVQQNNARVVGIEYNENAWQVPDGTFLLPGDYTFAVYAYFGSVGFSKTFSADVSFVSSSVPGMIANDETSAPEPATVFLFGLGIAGTIAAARKPRKW